MQHDIHFNKYNSSICYPKQAVTYNVEIQYTVFTES